MQHILDLDAKRQLSTYFSADGISPIAAMLQDLCGEFIAVACADHQTADLRVNECLLQVVTFALQEIRRPESMFLEAAKYLQVDPNTLFPDWALEISSDFFLAPNVWMLYKSGDTPSKPTERVVVVHKPEEPLVAKSSSSGTEIMLPGTQPLSAPNVTYAEMYSAVYALDTVSLAERTTHLHENMSAATVIQGVTLSRVRAQELWRDWDGEEYKNFGDWCYRVFGYKVRKAEQLASIAETLHQIASTSKRLTPELSWRILTLGWTKLYQITRIATAKTLEAWVSTAEKFSYHELEAKVKAELGFHKDDDEEPSTKPEKDDEGPELGSVTIEGDEDVDLDAKADSPYEDDDGSDWSLDADEDAVLADTQNSTVPGLSASPHGSGMRVGMVFTDENEYMLLMQALDLVRSTVGEHGVGKLVSLMAMNYLATNATASEGGLLTDLFDSLKRMQAVLGIQLAVQSENGWVALDGATAQPIDAADQDEEPEQAVVYDADLSASAATPISDADDDGGTESGDSGQYDSPEELQLITVEDSALLASAIAQYLYSLSSKESSDVVTMFSDYFTGDTKEFLTPKGKLKKGAESACASAFAGVFINALSLGLTLPPQPTEDVCSVDFLCDTASVIDDAATTDDYDGPDEGPWEISKDESDEDHNDDSGEFSESDTGEVDPFGDGYEELDDEYDSGDVEYVDDDEPVGEDSFDDIEFGDDFN